MHPYELDVFIALIEDDEHARNEAMQRQSGRQTL